MLKQRWQLTRKSYQISSSLEEEEGKKKTDLESEQDEEKAQEKDLTNQRPSKAKELMKKQGTIK